MVGIIIKEKNRTRKEKKKTKETITYNENAFHAYILSIISFINQFMHLYIYNHVSRNSIVQIHQLRVQIFNLGFGKAMVARITDDPF